MEAWHKEGGGGLLTIEFYIEWLFWGGHLGLEVLQDDR